MTVFFKLLYTSKLVNSHEGMSQHWRHDNFLQNYHGFTIATLKCVILKCLNAIYFICKQHVEYVEHSVNLQVFLLCTRPEGYLQFPGRAAHTAGTPQQKISVVLKAWLFQTAVYLETSNGSVTSRCYRKDKEKQPLSEILLHTNVLAWLNLVWLSAAS